jgi:Uma2 family endonuclease
LVEHLICNQGVAGSIPVRGSRLNKRGSPIAPDPTDDSRFERIDGRRVERPVLTAPHSMVQTQLVLLLAQALRGSPGKAGTEWSITRPGHADRGDPDYLTADVLVAYPPFRRAKNGHLAVPGFLAVEVLSPGQELFDKALLYAAWGTPHVWIVNPETCLAFEFHGGPTFMIQREYLYAGDLTVSLADVFETLNELDEFADSPSPGNSSIQS